MLTFPRHPSTLARRIAPRRTRSVETALSARAHPPYNVRMGLGELCAIAAALSWALGSILFSRIGRVVPAGAMNLGKLVCAGLLLSITRVAIGSLGALAEASATAWLCLAASAVAGLTIGDTAYFAAMDAIGVSRAMLLLSSAPVFTTLGGVLLFGERLGGLELVGIVLVVMGVGLVVFRPRDPSAPRDAKAGRGLVLGLVAALGQAAGSLFSRRAMQDGIDPLAAGAGRLVIGAIGLAILAAVTGHLRAWLVALREGGAFWRVGSASLVGSYLGIWLAQTAIARSASVGVAATLLALSPVFALPIAHAMGVERVRVRSVVGAVLGVLGVAVLSIR